MSARGDSIRVRPDSIHYNPPGEFDSLPVGGYWSVDQVEDANRRAGFHFFDADTKRFFRSRIGGTLYGGRFFVTSEQGSGWNGERRYSVRFARRDGSRSKPCLVSDTLPRHGRQTGRLSVPPISTG